MKAAIVAFIAAREKAKTVLHVGCGLPDPEKLPDVYFPHAFWHEVRLDIDPGVRPDIVANLIDMSMVPSASVDAVWSSHNLEHLCAHEVPLALAEFLRVLRPGGFALITLPDLQQVAEMVARGQIEDAAYMSPAGPIAPLDILYGYRPAIEEGNGFMAHRTGFTAQSLANHLGRAGFANVHVERDGIFALWGVGLRPLQ